MNSICVIRLLLELCLHIGDSQSTPICTIKRTQPSIARKQGPSVSVDLFFPMVQTLIQCPSIPRPWRTSPRVVLGSLGSATSGGGRGDDLHGALAAASKTGQAHWGHDPSPTQDRRRLASIQTGGQQRMSMLSDQSSGCRDAR